jgi:hypothetical protein
MSYHKYPSYVGQPDPYDRTLPIPIIGWTEEVDGVSLPILTPETPEYRAELEQIHAARTPYRGPSYTADELDEKYNDAARRNGYAR